MTTTPLSYIGSGAHFDISGDWGVFVRDDDTRELIGELGDYSTATFIARFNEVGTWELRTRAVGAALDLIRLQRVSLVLRVGGLTVLSGPLTRVERTYDQNGDQLAAYGASDLIWAASRIVRATGVDHFWRIGTAAYCLTELMKAFATGSDGRTPRITVADVPQGSWDAGFAARWVNLLETMQGVAYQVTPTYGFDVRDLVFETWEPEHDETIFSVELGTMASYQLSAQRPDLNWVAVLGQGELAQREVVFVEGDVGPWWQVEDVKDRRDIEQGNREALVDAGREALVEGARPVAVQVTPVDTPAQTFGRDYGLGDVAEVVFSDGTRITDTISEVTIQLSENKPLSVIPTVGDPQMTLDTFRRLGMLSRRLSLLEAQ